MSKETKKTPFEITASYLMWVGAEHYGTIEDYTGEVVKMGVSKRLSNVHIARKLMEPGAVIFLAHDEHEYTECPECVGNVECGECRKRYHERCRLEDEVLELEERLDAAREAVRLASEADKDGPRKEVARLKRLIANRVEKAKTIASVSKECETCEGHGRYNGSTGGRVVVDGEHMDYRAYNYWLHQPKKWSPEGKTVVAEMCEICGGTGRLPEGKVFGALLPSDVEYILKADDNLAKQVEIEEAGFKTVTTKEVSVEIARGCGKRREGGFYVRTGTGERTEDTKALVDKLVAAGHIEPEGAELIGTFVRFVNPIDIPGVKRFRGLKTFSLIPEAEDEVEMAVEALGDAA